MAERGRKSVQNREFIRIYVLVDKPTIYVLSAMVRVRRMQISSGGRDELKASSREGQGREP